MKWTATILAYVYWPLLYFTAYRPFIVPRLDQWHHIPSWITWPAMVGFIALLAACGMRRSHKSIFVRSLALALFLQGLVFAMSRLHMPSFLKSYEAGFLPDAIIPILIIAATSATLGEAGRFLVTTNKDASNKPSHHTVDSRADASANGW